MSLLASVLLRAASVKRRVAIRDCVHYCGFRYGRRELNPYEQYQHGLAAGLPRTQLREAFVDFLLHYRPRHLGDALGVPLSREYALWALPWRAQRRRQTPAWVSSAREVVDVMTHFSEQGIPAQLVESEHLWHERAHQRIASAGYRPGVLNYARAEQLASAERSAFLVTDGNHRIAAMSALGADSVTLTTVIGGTVFRQHAARWPLVRSGAMTLADALAIFDVYHRGNQSPPRAALAAELV